MATQTSNPTEGKGYRTESVPVQLVVLQTSALDLVTDYVPGFEGNVIALSFLTTEVGTGAGATQSISLTIDNGSGAEAPSGGVLTLALADTTPTGKIKAATAIDGTNAKNHFTKTGKISVKVAASGTAFTAGSGAIRLLLQNTQDF